MSKPLPHLVLVAMAVAWGSTAAWGTPLPPADATGAPTLTAQEAASAYHWMRLVMGLVMGLLVLSVGANLYLAWTVRRYQETVERLAQSMEALHETHAAMREVAQYWLERRHERLAREEHDLHAASRFHVTPRRGEHEREG